MATGKEETTGCGKLTSFLYEYTHIKKEVSLPHPLLTLWPRSVSKLYRLSDRLLSTKLVPTSADRGCHMNYNNILPSLSTCAVPLGCRPKCKQFSFLLGIPPRWPPLWSSGQSSWQHIRRSGFNSRHYQKKKVVGSGTGSTQPREYNWGATR
jgi:hypothetical protein